MSLLFCVKYGIIKSGVFKTVASKKNLIATAKIKRGEGLSCGLMLMW
jgi:hypothetical protein